MKAVDRLKRDHKILRAKLDVIESALKMGPSTWFVLREVCFTLARQLRDHIKREDDLVAACRKAMNPKVLAEVVVEHKDEPEHLRTVNRLFLAEKDQSLERVGPALTEVIEGLRRHMKEEEVELFPILERTLAEPGTVALVTTEATKHFDETMTVNRVLHDFPGAKRELDRLFVNIPTEGCACLDEVAWAHGMEAKELLARLERAIDACGCAKHQTSPEESFEEAGV